MKDKVRPICESCAGKLHLTPLAGGFIVGEPCADCGSFAGTAFTDLMKPVCRGYGMYHHKCELHFPKNN